MQETEMKEQQSSNKRIDELEALLAAQAIAFQDQLKGIEDEKTRVEAQEKEKKAKEMKDKLIHAVEQTVHSTKDDKHQIEVKEGILKQFHEIETLTLANDALTAQLKERNEQLMEQETQLNENNDHFIKQEIEANAQLESIKNLHLEIESLSSKIEELNIDSEGMHDENMLLKNSNTEMKDTVENYELLQKKVEDDLKISEGLKNYEREKEIALKETEIAGVIASMVELKEKHRLEILR
jgi:hypothetical protein